MIPTGETARSMIQEEFFHNFRGFNNSAIYRIITSKSRDHEQYQQITITYTKKFFRLTGAILYIIYNIAPL